MQIPTIKITSKGETYSTNRATSITNPRQSLNEEQEYSIINEIDMESIQNNYENKANNELTHQDESWKVATCNKKSKVTPCTSSRKAIVANKQQWLQEINLRNSFSTLPEEKVTDPVEKPITRIAKPPPIYIDAQIIDPLIELLNNTAGKENYSIKQLKVVQVKVRTNTPETFRKVTKALKEKNAGYHTYQLKADRSFKAVIRGLHPKTNTNNICEELAKIGHQVRSMNNITRYDTKQPLPLFLIELEPKNNNKEIFKIKKVLNTIVTVEPPRHKKTYRNAYGVNNMDTQKITATETRRVSNAQKRT